MVQLCHHFGPAGSAAPRNAVPATAVPAFVAMAPVKAASPPVAAGDAAAGVQSSWAAEVGCGANAVNSAAVPVADDSMAFAASSTVNCTFDPLLAWNTVEISASSRFLSC